MEDAERQILAAESDMILLPASDGVCREWCKIVVKHRLTGVQVHDARLAAMYVHGVRHILTFKADDFSRLDNLRFTRARLTPDPVSMRLTPRS